MKDTEKTSRGKVTRLRCAGYEWVTFGRPEVSAGTDSGRFRVSRM